VIVSRSEVGHQRHLDEVLGILLEDESQAFQTKCKFWVQQLDFVIGPGGLSQEKHKVDAILNLPTPPDITVVVRSFSGLGNDYRRFVKIFSEIACPRHEITLARISTSAIKNRLKR